MATDKTDEAKTDIEMLERACEFLREVGYEAVQIIATKLNDEGETVTVNKGFGNVHARLSMCEEWARVRQADAQRHFIEEE